MKNRSAQ